MTHPNFMNSSIFLKWVMASSGLLLILFVVGHLAGNLQVFLGADAFNTYSHFLQSTGELLWIARSVLIIAILLHIYTAIRLQSINMKANPQKYVKRGYKKSTIYSRTMLVSGLMLMAFLVYHLLHYTARITDPEYQTQEYYETYGTQIRADGLEIAIDNDIRINAEDTHAGILQRHDTYSMVVDGFRKPHIAIIYVIGVILLGMHLTHALQSMFQTLGLSSPIFSPKVMALSKWFGWAVTVLYSTIPLSIMLGLIGGGQ